jgi:hypothetical protein
MGIHLIRIVKFSAAAGILAALAFGGEAVAQKKKEAAMPKPAACRTIMSESDCTPREDCTWREAVMDKKSGKERRKASCAAKPKPKPGKGSSAKAPPSAPAPK